MRLCDLGGDLTRRLLGHIGTDPPPPTVQGLRTVHRAFLDAVPYENLQIRAGIPTGLHPVESAERIVTGRGGYCYHLNGALGSLLYGLGFGVRLVIGNPDPADPAGWGRHVVLLVDFGHECTWMADVGIGDGFRDPLPLRPGHYRQEPFAYAIVELNQPPDEQANDGSHEPAAESRIRPRARWRFEHDPLGTLRAFDLDPAGYDPQIVARTHHVQSTSAESPFVRKLTVQSRRADHTLLLRGCVLTTVDASGKRSLDLDGETEWWAAIADGFGIRIDGLDREVRDRLWQRTRQDHEAWLAAGRP